MRELLVQIEKFRFIGQAGRAMSNPLEAAVRSSPLGLAAL
jgi:hypothetical protein